MAYCPFAESLQQVWVHHIGKSECLLDMRWLTSVNLFILLLICGFHISFVQKPHRFNHYSLAESKFYQIQMMCIRIMAGVEIILLFLDLIKTPIPSLPYGGYSLLVTDRLLVWPITCLITIREQKLETTTTSSSTPKIKSHNIGLIFLFIWSFVSYNMILVNVWSKSSFFRLEDLDEVVHFALYLIQYILALVIVLGVFLAPGVPSRPVEKFRRLLEKRPVSYSSSTENLAEDEVGPKKYSDEDGLHLRRPSVVATTKGWASSVRVLAPFIWPSSNVMLQVFIYMCFVLFALGRVTNMYVPIYSKYVVDSMLVPGEAKAQGQGQGQPNCTQTSNNSAPTFVPFRWDIIMVYVGLKILQGGVAWNSGLIPCCITLLWQKVQQYTCQQLQVQFFEHLHSLSMRWHISRKTGEIARTMDRGSEGFTNLLNYMCFNLIPVIFDITIAIVYITVAFNVWMGVIVVSTIGVYAITMICMTEWRVKVNRAKNLADNAKTQFSLDSLLNAETIKECANEEHKRDRYELLVKEFQRQDWYFNLSSSLNDIVQLGVINAGLLAGSLLCVHAIVNHEQGLTPGDYVLFITYLNQVFEPLNNFGKYYKFLQKCVVDMENMLSIFQQETDIKDTSDAPDLQIQGGQVEFRDVSFSYLPGQTVLKRVSFKIPAGKSLALVGPSGGGKTSITRLMLRFYDPQAGKILIDGQNIKRVTQKSLRKAIGVVPQDTCLFNDTLRYNIKFPRLDCTDEEMFEAANVACINRKVLSFPCAYETMVGERGLKLSGGEKQRISIARAVVKNPTVIILDEATSSLDTHTERQIQSSLQKLCENRTSIIVAHRLSTVVHADQILVLKNGKVHESGTHEALLAKEGLYASMWNEQLKSAEKTFVESKLGVQL